MKRLLVAVAMAAAIGGTAASPIGESLGLGVVVKAESIIEILDSQAPPEGAWFAVTVYNGSEIVGAACLESLATFYAPSVPGYQIPNATLGMSESQPYTSAGWTGPETC
jgi:hypothetical protein